MQKPTKTKVWNENIWNTLLAWQLVQLFGDHINNRNKMIRKRFFESLTIHASFWKLKCIIQFFII